MLKTISPSSSSISTPEREVSTEMNDEDFSSSNPSTTVAERLRQVEIELAEKKLALTQALCENQELIHQLKHSNSVTNDSDTISLTSNRSNTNQNSTVSWLSKTVNSIKEVASSTNRTKVN